jgi:hypothetical protein
VFLAGSGFLIFSRLSPFEIFSLWPLCARPAPDCFPLSHARRHLPEPDRTGYRYRGTAAEVEDPASAFTNSSSWFAVQHSNAVQWRSYVAITESP